MHIYATTIKVLFPHSQCKSLFRKLTASTIKIYNSQYNSNHTLTEEQFSVLKKYFFSQQHSQKTMFFQETANLIPPRSDNNTLISFFTRIEQELGCIDSNLTLKIKEALNDVRNNQSIVMKPCDKGREVCIMNTRDYITKIYTQFRDRKTQKAPTTQETQ